MKTKKKSLFPDDMDKEMIPLCTALNRFKGIETTFCCFGHGVISQFYISLKCSDLMSLKQITKVFERYSRFADKYFIIECEYPGPLSNRCKRNELAIYIRLRKSVGSESYYEHKSPMTIDDCNALTKRFNRTSKKFKKTICEKSKGNQNG